MFSAIWQPKLALIRMLNGLLKQEPWAQQRIQSYADKIVRLEVGCAALALLLMPDGTVTQAQSEAQPDATLRLDAQHLPALLQSLDTSQLMAYVHIDGEAGLANLVSELAQSLRWDRYHHMAQLFGPVLTAHLLRTERVAMTVGEQAVQRILTRSAEQLSQQQAILVDRASAQMLDQQLAALESRIEQLERCIK